VASIKAIASTGHCEVDVNGKIITHMELDVITYMVGTATI
jgi:hypothetical protein